MICIQNLSKRYGEQTVLNDISLTIAQGEIHGLLGVSGAGKSTLLRCINGLESYESGSLKINGVEVNTLRGAELRRYRKKIGMIFQDFALLDRLTAFENVLLPMQCWQYPKNQMRNRAEELLEMVGIGDKRDFFPRELSGGQQQRVAIARTLALEPEVLLCDEATSALDPGTTTSVLALLKSINSCLNLTIVLVTHQMKVVREICENVSIMEHGIIALTDSVEATFTHEPPALARLAGRIDLTVPAGRVCFKVSLREPQISEPFLSDLALSLDLNYSVLHARADTCGAGRIGHFYIAVDQNDKERTLAYIRNKDIAAEEYIRPNVEESRAFSISA